MYLYWSRRFRILDLGDFMSLDGLTISRAAEPAVGAARVRHEERQRLSSDLHDTLGPALAGLRLRLDTVAARLSHDPELRRLVLDAAAETAYAGAELRRVIYDLGPSDLHLGLPGALRLLAVRFGGTDVAITVEIPDTPPSLPASLEVALYRIACEGLANAVRHGTGRQATLRLTTEHDRVVLEIADDGVGLAATRPGRGLGLSSMKKRAQDAGGRCDVLSRLHGGSGTLVRATLPRRAA